MSTKLIDNYSFDSFQKHLFTTLNRLFEPPLVLLFLFFTKNIENRHPHGMSHSLLCIGRINLIIEHVPRL